MKQVRVLIAGAGMAGLAHALALAQRGHRVTVLERAKRLTSVGAGIQLGPNGLKPLQKWGLLNAVQARACQPSDVEIRSWQSGQVIARMSNHATKQKFGLAPITLLRADLQEVLLVACQASANIDLHWDCTVRPDGVSALLKQFDSEVLLGADGLWSQVRHVIGDTTAPRFTGKLAFRALIPTAQLSARWHRQVGLWLGAGAHLVHYPVKGGAQLNLIAMWQSARPANSDQPWGQESVPAPWHSSFAQASDALAELFEQCPTGSLWSLFDRPPSKPWHSHNICLVGDAAHPMQAHLAQGASMALEDAQTMSQVLGTHADFNSDFTQFTQQRFARTSLAQKKAAQYGQIYQASGMTAWARNLYLSSPLAKAQSNGLAWLYRG
jgi:2-polyprenyl-6-methoxyphenol hydroxylase-like FAD-dependent oxidoreductase